MTIPLQFASLYNGQVFVWSDCLPDLGTVFLVGNMAFVRDVYLAVAPHFHGLYSSLEFQRRILPPGCPKSCIPNPVKDLFEVYEDMVEVLLVLEIFLTGNS